jgi:hypothetical protein
MIYGILKHLVAPCIGSFSGCWLVFKFLWTRRLAELDKIVEDLRDRVDFIETDIEYDKLLERCTLKGERNGDSNTIHSPK